MALQADAAVIDAECCIAGDDGGRSWMRCTRTGDAYFCVCVWRRRGDLRLSQ